MLKKICIAETKKEINHIFKLKQEDKNLICLPLNLETYLYCLENNIKFIDPFTLIDNNFHKKVLVDGEKFINSIKFRKNISETLILEIKSILRFRFYSISLISELIDKILKENNSISFVISNNKNKTHTLSALLVHDIISNLYGNLPIEKISLKDNQNQFEEQAFSYNIKTKTYINKKNILLNSLGYNFKRLIFSKIFNPNYKFYSFGSQKVNFFKKLLLNLLKVELIDMERKKVNLEEIKFIEDIEYNFPNENFKKTMNILIHKLQIYFLNFNCKKKAIDSFLEKNTFSLILTNMVKGEGGLITESYFKASCPSICISHGTVTEKFNIYDEIYKKIIASAVFGGGSKYFAIQSKIAEKSLGTHKINGKKIITGNILFSERGKKNIFIKKNKILFAVTLKDFYNLQFLGVEMFYEFVRNLDLLEKLSKEKKIEILIKIHPSEAKCLSSLKNLFPNLIFTNKPVEKLFKKCFVTISFSSSVIEDSLNSQVPVILFDQWKRYMHCDTQNKEGSAVYYVNNQKDLSKILDNILKLNKFNFEEFVYATDSKQNINNKIFTLIN